MTVQPLENVQISGRVAVDTLVGEIGLWPGVEVAELRVGGAMFLLGSREIGHLHEDADGGCHAHVTHDSARLIVPIRNVADLAGALEILRGSYQRAKRSTLRPCRAGRTSSRSGHGSPVSRREPHTAHPR